MFSSPEGSFESVAAWDQTSGNLTVTVASGGLAAGSEHLLWFWVRNSATAQPNVPMQVIQTPMAQGRSAKLISMINQ